MEPADLQGVVPHHDLQPLHHLLWRSMWKQHAVPLGVSMEVFPCRSGALSRRSPQFPIWPNEEEPFRLETTSRRAVSLVLSEIFDTKKYFERKIMEVGSYPRQIMCKFSVFSGPGW